MPLRVRFVGADPPANQTEIELALAPLVEAGLAVTVSVLEPDDDLGWRVLLDRPGAHSCFRVRFGASSDEWAQAVQMALPSKPPSN